VSHRIFERILRPLVFRRACLFERHYQPSSLACRWTLLLLKYVVGPKDNDGVVFDPRCNELLIARIEVVGRPGLKPIIF
jgi:hypothetical protein